MAIIQRSGRELQVKTEAEKKQTDEEAEAQNHSHKINEERKERTETTDESLNLKEKTEMLTEKTVQGKKEELKVYHPAIPFPQRLKQTKLDDQFSKFLNMFRKLEINILFAEALAQIPHYSKFMKEIIRKNRN